ncbi:MAG: cytochrome c biogenesis protein CcdA [bacterium]|nr:cytochrome c biogenesis protein CcdA [bacterium]
MNKKLLILVVAALLIFGTAFVLKTGNIGTTALWNLSNGGKWLLPLVGVSALIDSINPCAFSVLLLTIAFLFSIGKLRSGILKIGSAYILGIFLAYILIGLGIFQALHIFNTPHFIGKIGAILLLVLGLINLINYFFPAFPIKLRIPNIAHRKMAELMDKGSLLAVFLLGGLVGLCEFPCTGGPYLMVIGLLHDQATYFTGVGYLLLYNLIFILPLTVVLLIASNHALLEKVRDWQSSEQPLMRVGSGIAMIILGILIYFL